LIRVAIVGARCQRHGTGPWFAKHFSEAGALITGVLGRSDESAALAQKELKERFGIDTRGHSDWQEFLEKSRPDLLVIATPAESHLGYLQKALEAKLPVMVEKPFVWQMGRDNLSDAREILTAFEAKNIPLIVNTQWLESLPDFKKIYPECDMQKVHHFEMTLSPSSKGAFMLVDALPHAFSLLLEIKGLGQLENLSVEKASEEKFKIAGVYTNDSGPCSFQIFLENCIEQPRPFSYKINDCEVKRVLDLERYAMSFSAKNALFPLIDPMILRVKKSLNLRDKNAYNGAFSKIIEETKLLEQSVKSLNS
jgi:predicted dehydrogenase